MRPMLDPLVAPWLVALAVVLTLLAAIMGWVYRQRPPLAVRGSGRLHAPVTGTDLTEISKELHRQAGQLADHEARLILFTSQLATLVEIKNGLVTLTTLGRRNTRRLQALQAETGVMRQQLDDVLRDRAARIAQVMYGSPTAGNPSISLYQDSARSGGTNFSGTNTVHGPVVGHDIGTLTEKGSDT